MRAAIVSRSSREIEPVLARGPAEQVSPAQHDAAARFDEAQQRPDERLGLDPSRRGRPQRGVRGDVRLVLPDERGGHDLQPADAVRRAAAFQRFERADLLLGGRHDELAAPVVGDLVRRAERVQPLGPLDAQLRLQRPGGIVDPGVDDAAVVGAGLHARAGMAFGDRHGQPGVRQFGGSREAGDTAADDEGVDNLDVHQDPCRINDARSLARARRRMNASRARRPRKTAGVISLVKKPACFQNSRNALS